MSRIIRLFGLLLFPALLGSKVAAQCEGFNFTVSNDGLCPPLITFSSTGIPNSDWCSLIRWTIIPPSGPTITYWGCSYFATLDYGMYNVTMQVFLPSGEVCTITRMIPIFPTDLELEPESAPSICTPSNDPITFCIPACQACPECCTWIVSNQNPVVGGGCINVTPNTLGCKNLTVRYTPPNTGCIIERTFDCIVNVYPPCPATFANTSLDFCPGQPMTVNFTASENCGQQTIVDYGWTIQGGSPGGGSGGTISSTFPGPGTYAITLRITTAAGCTYENTRNITVNVSTPSQPQIAWVTPPPAKCCSGDVFPIRIVQPLPLPAVGQWVWEGLDNTGNPIGPGISHSPPSDTAYYRCRNGQLTFRLLHIVGQCTTYSNWLSADGITPTVDMSAPIVDRALCSSPHTSTFTLSQIQPGCTYTAFIIQRMSPFDYPYGNPPNDTAGVVQLAPGQTQFNFTFNSYPDYYDIHILVCCEGCCVKRQFNAYVVEAQPCPNFVINNTTVCTGECANIQSRVSLCPDNAPAGIPFLYEYYYYQRNVDFFPPNPPQGPGTRFSSDENPCFSTQEPGVYYIRQRVANLDLAFCPRDTFIGTAITVNGLRATATPMYRRGCLDPTWSDTITINVNSVPAQINNYVWSYEPNDGSVSFQALASTGNQHKWTATFSQKGVYKISVELTNSAGCRTTLDLGEFYSGIRAVMTVPDKLPCKGVPFCITGSSQINAPDPTANAFAWEVVPPIPPHNIFGTPNEMCFNFPEAGTYRVRFTVGFTPPYANYLCTHDTFVDIQVTEADGTLIVPDDEQSCDAYVAISVIAPEAVGYRYVFTDLDTSFVLPSPVALYTLQHQFSNFGCQPVEVHIVDINGCRKTMRDTVCLRGPRAELNFCPKRSCTDYRVYFENRSYLFNTIRINFGDTVIELTDAFIGMQEYAPPSVQAECGLFPDYTNYQSWYRDLRYSELAKTNPWQNAENPFQQDSFYAFTIQALAYNVEICPRAAEFYDTLYIFREAIPAFSFDDTPRCLPTTLEFKNLTRYAVDYEWDVDADGTVEGFTRQFRYEVSPERSGQTISIRLRAKNANNCWAETTMTYTPLVTPIARFDVPRHNCLGEPTIFENRTQNSGSATYFWDFGDGNTSTSPEPVHVYQNRGTYTIKLVVRDQNGCVDSTVRYDYVSVSQPVADFILNDDPNLPLPLRLYYPGDTRLKFTDKSAFADSIVWEIEAKQYGEIVVNEREFEREYVYDDTLNPIRLIAYDAQGCTSVVEKGPIYIIGLQIHIPNIFSPNDDGANDVFRIVYNGPKKYSLKIFDRWGMQVSNEITDYKVGWNGKDRNGNPCTDGVYYYIFKLDEMVLTGEITLVR